MPPPMRFGFHFAVVVTDHELRGVAADGGKSAIAKNADVWGGRSDQGCAGIFGGGGIEFLFGRGEGCGARFSDRLGPCLPTR